MECVNAKNCNANAENSIILDDVLTWFFFKVTVSLASTLFI